MTQAPPRGVLPTLCLTVTVSYGVLYYAFAVLAPSITANTGWSLTAITAAFSLGMFSAGMAGIAVGRVIQARGPRLVMATGGLVGSAGLLAVASAPTYPWFVLTMTLCGVGAAGLFYPPAFATITHWHGARRVAALTALTLVAGLASTIFAPVTMLLADQASWRAVYVVFAALLLVVAVPGHLIALNHPWRTDADLAHETPDREVLTSGRFILIAVGGALITLVMYASLIALIPLLVSRGMSPATGAWALGLGGAGQVAGRLLYPRLTAGMALHKRVSLVTGCVAVMLGALAVTPGPGIVLIGSRSLPVRRAGCSPSWARPWSRTCGDHNGTPRSTVS